MLKIKEKEKILIKVVTLFDYNNAFYFENPNFWYRN